MTVEIAFIKSESPLESRIALLPQHAEIIENPNLVLIEQGYGKKLGISDKDYESVGFRVVHRVKALEAKIICDPKIGDSEYVFKLKNKVLFGYFHAVQNPRLTKSLQKNKNLCIAWEDMYDNNEHIFYKNNILAGFAAVNHASLSIGEKFESKKIAILGRGNTSIGAQQALIQFNNEIQVFGRHDEVKFKEKMNTFDIIINAVLWDDTRTDYIISKDDLIVLKEDCLIIDISCDIDGAIESSVPVNLEKPVYTVSGIKHYSVSNTPSIYFKTASNYFSEIVVKFISDLLTCDFRNSKILSNAIIISDGKIIDDKIQEFWKLNSIVGED